MTTIKTLPWGVSPSKIVNETIILDGCCFDDIKHPIYHNNFQDINNYCLLDTIGLDVEFIYSIFCFNDEVEGVHGEVGLGRLAKQDDNIVIQREQTLFNENDNSGRAPYLKEGVRQNYFSDSSLLIASTYDTGPLDSHLFKNTLSYNGGYVRLSEDGILFSSNGHITKLRPQDLIKFMSKSSASVSTGPISIKPLKIRPTKPKKGTIIFNEIKKKLEVYDGTEWKTVQLED